VLATAKVMDLGSATAMGLLKAMGSGSDLASVLAMNLDLA
jgi:hypothetical protein